MDWKLFLRDFPTSEDKESKGSGGQQGLVQIPLHTLLLGHLVSVVFPAPWLSGQLYFVETVVGFSHTAPAAPCILLSKPLLTTDSRIQRCQRRTGLHRNRVPPTLLLPGFVARGQSFSTASTTPAPFHGSWGHADLLHRA